MLCHKFIYIGLFLPSWLCIAKSKTDFCNSKGNTSWEQIHDGLLKYICIRTTEGRSFLACYGSLTGLQARSACFLVQTGAARRTERLAEAPSASRCHMWHPGLCLTVWWWLLLGPELCFFIFLDGMLGICIFGTDSDYLKAGIQAVICNSVKITLLAQTKGPLSSVCHHSITGFLGKLKTGWAGRDTFPRK